MNNPQKFHKMIPKPPSQGFAIIELLISITILVVAILGLIEVFLLAQNMVKFNQRKEYASSYAQLLIEEARGRPYDSLSGSFTGTAGNTTIPVTVTATRAITTTNMVGLKQITITYSFPHRGKTYYDYLTTYAGDNGLND